MTTEWYVCARVEFDVYMDDATEWYVCARVEFDVYMDDATSAKDAEHFRHVASFREALIENTLKCPCLNRSSRVAPQIRCA